MPNNRYDIFISYRRRDAGDKAEHLKDLLESKFKGRISFDRENLTGLFDVALARRIDRCKDFLLVVGKNSLVFDDEDFEQKQVELYNYLGSCTQSEFEQKIVELGPNASIDFVRIEIARAIHRKDINIIPVVPETTESFNFSKLNLPDDIVGIKRYEAVFYSDNPDALFKDVVPKIEKHLYSKVDRHVIKRLLISAFSFLLVFGACVGLWRHIQWQKLEQARQELMVTQIKNFVIEWKPDISLKQLQAVHDILDKMEFVEGGTFMMGTDSIDENVEACLETPSVQQTVNSFYMGRYEVSVSQWCGVMDLPYNKAEADLPMANVSLYDCLEFCDTLYSLTNLNFIVPTEAEWEYAARGGTRHNKTKYAGSDNPDKVAWYVENSHKRVHICDAKETEMFDNGINLYDMSGNISEWCLWTDSIHRLYCDMVSQKVTHSDVIYNQGVSVVRGGDYLSEPYQLTVYHRETPDRAQKSPNIGLRLIVKPNTR